MRAFLTLLASCVLSHVALSQGVHRFPLQPDGTDELSGQPKLGPDSETISALMGLESVTLNELTLPEAGKVSLRLDRVSLEDMQFGFHVNGQPAPGLMAGLDISVWKGEVVGDPGSDVFISFSKVGTRGWVDYGHKRYHLMPQPGDGLNWYDGYSVIVENEKLASLGVDLGMSCGFEDLDRNELTPEERPSSEVPQFLGGGNNVNLYECAVAVETDFQLFQVFGNDLAAETAYITMLLAAGSDRYIEQNNTRLVYPYVQFYTNSNDGWSSQDSGGNSIDLLNEFVAAWGGSALPGNADLGHFLSGAGLGGGVAYLGVLCETSNNFNFGVSGNLAGNVPFPIQQGPINWDFVVYTHELGHNFDSPHTHDFCPTPLDSCAPPAYFGACQSSQVCISNGTIMSYCHLCSGGISNITTYFHPAAQATMASHVQSCLPIVLGISSNPPVQVNPGVPTTLTANVTGSVNSVEMHYRFSTGSSYTVVPMANQGGGNYAATLPAADCLDSPQFFFRASDGAGPLSTQVFSASVGTATTAFFDDFQTNQGWSVGALDDDATTGVWTRVDPNPTDAQPGEGVNPGSGPFCFVTGQGSAGGSLGENDVDGGKTTLFSPTFNLAGEEATISYWRWYSNNTGASPGADVFEVEITSNGSTWVDVETVGPTGAGTTGGWVLHAFNVADFVTPSSAVQVRFIASDLGNGSIVEAGVDDFQVTLVDCDTGPQPPVADFTGSPTSGIRPLTVTFSDTSSGIATSWSWNFGDTGTSSSQNPVHTYTTAGTYSVSLTATGPDGTDTLTRTNYISVSEAPPTANFTGTPTVGTRPLTVSFTNTTTGVATSWSWSFGDTGTSNQQNPTHTYSLSGTYTVSLTATGPGGLDTETKGDYIIVTDVPPTADFTATPTSGVVPLTVSFTYPTRGGASSWSWSFGDTGTSNQQNPTHTYSFPGTFTVSMSATNSGGSDVETKTGYIVVSAPAPPVADFSASPTSGLVPLTVSFSDASTGDVTSWFWSFGDLGTSTQQNPTHTYAVAGTYSVILLASGPGGDNTETKTDYIVVSPPSAANFSASTASGGVPLSVSFTDLSTATVTSWSWDFGDMNTSNQQNPTHVYAAAGTYTVSLTVDGPGGADTSVMPDLVTVYPAATATFRNGTGINPPCFTPSLAVIGQTWTAGVDSAAVSGTTLTVILARTASSPGVVLSTGELLIDPSSPLLFNSFAVSSGGVDTHSFAIPNDVGFVGNTGHMQAFLFGPILQWCNAAELSVGFPAPSPAPLAGFNGSPLTGPAPHTVLFSDTSSGSITDCVWSFGDGSTSTLQNPPTPTRLRAPTRSA